MSDNVPAFSARNRKHHMSLRLKSYLVYTALIVYAVFLSTFIFHQKELLFKQFDEVQGAYDAEAALREVDLNVRYSIDAQVAGLSRFDLAHGMVHAREHIRLLQGIFEQMLPGRIARQPDLLAIRAAMAAAYAAPTPQNVKVLRDRLSRLKAKTEARLAKSSEHRHALVESFRVRSDTVAMTALLLGLLGLTLLGTINALFFRRLTRDVQTLRQRAGEIVAGRRRDALPVTRNDEVGQLIESINHMASELEKHEAALEIERRKQFHQEKMAAIGTLAAGIAHEVGNPIAAICALVEEIKRARAMGRCPYVEEGDVCKLEMVLRQAERLRGITREISAIASPRSDERQLLDFNGMIRSTCGLMRYDARWKNVELLLDLDNELPAISAVGDQLTQVIMNLLVNAVDALEGVEGRTPTIIVSTTPTEEGVRLVIRDNGCGMDRETLSHAIDTFFTTKAAEKGTGLGLSLCHSIVTAHNGRLEVDSTPNTGTAVKVFLPLGDSYDNQGHG